MYSLCVIASRDDIVVTQGGPAKMPGEAGNGKYAGWITLGEEDRYRPILNSEPVFDTAAQAKEYMQGIVAAAKEIVTIPGFQKEIPPMLRSLMGLSKPTAESAAVGAVIALSRQG